MVDQANPAIYSNPSAEAHKASAKGKAAINGKIDGKNFSYFAILFYLLLSSMTIRQNTVLTQSKVLQVNSAKQEELNKEDANIKFSELPPNANTAEINKVQIQNQEYAAIKEEIQNSLITLRQNAQVEMTETSTNVNIMEQDASENSGWLHMLSAIFTVIDEMTKNS